MGMGIGILITDTDSAKEAAKMISKRKPKIHSAVVFLDTVGPNSLPVSADGNLINVIHIDHILQITYWSDGTLKSTCFSLLEQIYVAMGGPLLTFWQGSRILILYIPEYAPKVGDHP